MFIVIDHLVFSNTHTVIATSLLISDMQQTQKKALSVDLVST